jgi:hypothetical protein
VVNDLIKTRSSSALIGLAIGESLSWTTQYSRAQCMPAWLNRIRNDIDKENYSFRITSTPVPFALNQNTIPLLPNPADITEWAAWTALLLVKNDGVLTEVILQSAWQELANQRSDIRGRISVQAALRNIQNGLTIPACGRFNPHYFDDAALPRAVAIGAVNAGDNTRSAEIAALDASFTQYEDGIFCARAVASAVSSACIGASIPEIIAKSLAELPSGSLSRRIVLKALDGTSEHNEDILSTAYFLSSEISNLEYSYGNSAHEVLACALSIITQTKGDFERTISVAALVPRPGAGLLSICATLAMIISGYEWQQKLWIKSILDRFHGNYVPLVKDIDLIDLTDQIGFLSSKLSKQRDEEDI